MYHVPLVFQCIYGCSDERKENGDVEEEREWRLPGLLYADDLEEDLWAIVGQFVEVCRRRGLKVNAGKNNAMVLEGIGV